MPRAKKTPAASGAGGASASGESQFPILVSIVNVKVFANLIKLFANVLNEGNIYFTADTMKISGLDQAHVCLYKCILGKETVVYDNSDGVEYVIGVSFQVLSKILSSCSGVSSISIMPDKTSNKLHMNLTSSKGVNSFIVNQMEIEGEELEVPDIDYIVQQSIDTGAVKDGVDQADKLGADVIDITRTSKSEIRIKYSTDMVEGDSLVYSPPSAFHTEEDSIRVATSYLKGFVSAGPYGPQIELSYSGSEYPLRARSYFVGASGEISKTEYVEIHIAPKIDDDDDE